VTNAFLETRQHRFLIAGVDVDDPVRRETDPRQRWREQILPGDAPQDLAFRARRDAGGEEGGRSAVDGGIATSRHFVQRPERQAAARQSAVNGLDPKREHSPGTLLQALKALNLLAKPQNGGWLDRSTDALVKRFQDGIVLDLFLSTGKSQLAKPAPNQRLRAKKCGSRCDDEQIRTVVFLILPIWRSFGKTAAV